MTNEELKALAAQGVKAALDRIQEVRDHPERMGKGMIDLAKSFSADSLGEDDGFPRLDPTLWEGHAALGRWLVTAEDGLTEKEAEWLWTVTYHDLYKAMDGIRRPKSEARELDQVIKNGELVPLSELGRYLAHNEMTDLLTSVKGSDFVYNEFTDVATWENSKGRLQISGVGEVRNLSVSALMLYDKAVQILTSQNYNRARPEQINGIVKIPLIEYGEEVRGLKLQAREMDDPEDQAKEDNAAKRRIRAFRDELVSGLKSIKAISGYMKDKGTGGALTFSYIANYEVGNKMIRVVFDQDSAARLIHAYRMPYPDELQKLDPKNPNAYRIARAILQHSTMKNNLDRPQENTLGVASLLKSTPAIPTKAYLDSIGQRNWKTKIKGSLELALDQIVECSFLKRWEYRDPGTGKTFTPETAKRLSWDAYSALMVDYVMMDIVEMDHYRNEVRTKRAERKKKELEAKKIESD